MTSIALLILRATVGSLLAGHGAQKLFGAFEGPGFQGTTGWLESMGLKPGRFWAWLAGTSEFLGGLLTAVGALNPIGPLLALGSMLMATLKVHRGKPIWVTAGGAELPVTNMAAVTAIAIAGPGRLSVDGLLGTRLSRWLFIPGVVAVVAAVAIAAQSSDEAMAAEETAEETVEEAGAELQAGPEERLEEAGEGDGESQGAGAGRGTRGTRSTPGTEDVVSDAAIAATMPESDRGEA
jgi:putative oxidoreductase